MQRRKNCHLQCDQKKLILTPSQKLPKNVGDLGKLIVAKGFKKLPKVQKIAQSGHTGAGHRGVGCCQQLDIFLYLLQWTATVAGRSRFTASLNEP